MIDRASSSGGSSTIRDRRIYAIGSVHGRLELLDELLGLIDADAAGRGAAPTRLILMGNIVNRGPDSAAVLDLCMQLSERMTRFSVLKGNHEALMVRALRGDLEALTIWLVNGGVETLLSFGVPAADMVRQSALELLEVARQGVSPEIVHWLDSLPLAIRSGRKLFVNGSLRPRVNLARLSSGELLHGKGGFVARRAFRGAVVVHARAAPDRRLGLGRRLGVFSPDPNLLYALGLEGGQRWVLAADGSGATGVEPALLPDYYLLRPEFAIQQVAG